MGIISTIKNVASRMFGPSTVYVVTAHDQDKDKTREIIVYADHDQANAEYLRLRGIYPPEMVTLASRSILPDRQRVHAFSFAHSSGQGRSFVLSFGDRAALRFSVERLRDLSFGVSATADWTDTTELRAAAFCGPVILGVGFQGPTAYRIAKAIGRPIDNTGSAESTVRFVH